MFVMFVKALLAQRVLPLPCYGQEDGVVSLSFKANEDTIKLTGLLQELYEMILSWRLPEYELGQYEFMVSHVLSKKNVGYRVEPMCKLGCKIKNNVISRFKKEIPIYKEWFE